MHFAQFQPDHCIDGLSCNLSGSTQNSTIPARDLSFVKSTETPSRCARQWAINWVFLDLQAKMAFAGEVGSQPKGKTLFLFSCFLSNSFFNLFFSHTHTRPHVKLNIPGNGIIIGKDKHEPANERGPSGSNNKFNMRLQTIFHCSHSLTLSWSSLIYTFQIGLKASLKSRFRNKKKKALKCQTLLCHLIKFYKNLFYFNSNFMY